MALFSIRKLLNLSLLLNPTEHHAAWHLMWGVHLDKIALITGKRKLGKISLWAYGREY